MRETKGGRKGRREGARLCVCVCVRESFCVLPLPLSMHCPQEGIHGL